MEIPAEVFHLILNQCEVQELKSFLSVSEEIRQMILTTPRLMRKLKVIFFHGDWKSKIPFVVKHGKHVRSLKFDFCPMSNTKDIREILRLTPNLEELEAKIDRLTDEGNAEEETSNTELNLTSLKTLKIAASDDITKSMLHDLRNSKNICKFSIEAYFEMPVRSVGDFLSKQNNLKEIVLQGAGDDNTGLRTVFTEALMSKKDLKLKTLILSTGMEYNKTFSDFLLKQSEFLEVFEFKSFVIDFHYFRLVFRNFHNLKKLGCTINYMFNERRCVEFADYLLPTVTEFETLDYIEDYPAFAAVLKVFPNLEVLNAPIVKCQLEGILENLPKLRTLKADAFKLEMLLLAKSSSLQELEVSNCESMVLDLLWEKLAEDCPNIEKLMIKDVATYRFPKETNAEIKMILMNLKNFKRLNYVRIENDKKIPPQISSDHDNPADENFAQNQFQFKFLLKKKFDQTFHLKFSSYFSQHQVEAISQIRRDLKVSEVIENA